MASPDEIRRRVGVANPGNWRSILGLTRPGPITNRNITVASRKTYLAVHEDKWKNRKAARLTQKLQDAQGMAKVGTYGLHQPFGPFEPYDPRPEPPDVIVNERAAAADAVRARARQELEREREQRAKRKRSTQPQRRNTPPAQPRRRNTPPAQPQRRNTPSPSPKRRRMNSFFETVRKARNIGAESARKVKNIGVASARAAGRIGVASARTVGRAGLASARTVVRMGKKYGPVAYGASKRVTMTALRITKTYGPVVARLIAKYGKVMIEELMRVMMMGKNKALELSRLSIKYGEEKVVPAALELQTLIDMYGSAAINRAIKAYRNVSGITANEAAKKLSANLAAKVREAYAAKNKFASAERAIRGAQAELQLLSPSQRYTRMPALQSKIKNAEKNMTNAKSTYTRLIKNLVNSRQYTVVHTIGRNVYMGNTFPKNAPLSNLNVNIKLLK